MAVAGMAAYSEIGRAHEIANDMRRINKQLKEAQQWAVVYNNRERLFGMPVTNVSLYFSLYISVSLLLSMPLSPVFILLITLVCPQNIQIK